MSFFTTTTTAEMPRFIGDAAKPTLIMVANITSGSLAVQYKVGAAWVTAETYTTSTVKELVCSGMSIKLVITGTVEVMVG